MSEEERAQLIDLLTLMANGYSAEYFEGLSDEELQEKYNRMIEVEVSSRINS